MYLGKFALKQEVTELEKRVALGKYCKINRELLGWTSEKMSQKLDVREEDYILFEKGLLPLEGYEDSDLIDFLKNHVKALDL